MRRWARTWTYGDVEKMLGAFREELLVSRSQRKRLEHISRPPIPLEHRMINHIPQIYKPSPYQHFPFHPSTKKRQERKRTTSLPINSDQLTPRTPIPMRLIIARTHPHPLRIHPNQMRPIMLNQIAHPASLLEHLVRRVLREREDVFGRVLFFFV